MKMGGKHLVKHQKLNANFCHSVGIVASVVGIIKSLFQGYDPCGMTKMTVR